MNKTFLTFITVLIAGITLLGGGSYTIYRDKNIVLDNSTGLYWTKCTMGYNSTPTSGNNCDGYNQRYRWWVAIETCSKLDFGGRSDWRLPSVKELQSIVRYNNTNANVIGFNEDVFPGTELNHYWSSTTHKKDSNLAWTIDFHFGNVTYHTKIDNGLENEFYVRCVAGP